MNKRPLLPLLSVGLMLPASQTQAAISLTQIGATNNWEVSFDPITFVANSNAGEFDWLVIKDFFNTNSSAQGDFVKLAGVGPNPAAGSSVTISASFQFSSTDAPSFSGNTVDATFWDNGGAGTIQSDTVAVAIPEPSAVVLPAPGGLARLPRRA